jgi:hypothetical protein
MTTCGCGSPACCCQPAVAGGVVYADLWGELSTHLALQALFSQSSPVREPLLQAFPFPSSLGEVTLHPLFLACVFVYSSRGKWAFPPLLWSFPPMATFTSFPAPDCWACAAVPASRHVCLQLLWEVGLPPLLWSFPPMATFTSFPALDYWAVLLLLPATMFIYSSCGRWVFPPSPVGFSSLRHSHKLSRSWLLGARPRSLQSLSGLSGLFIYSPGKDSLPPIFVAQCAPPSLSHVFIVLIAYYSVSLFSLGGVGLSRGLCCSGPGLSVGVPHTA